MRILHLVVAALLLLAGPAVQAQDTPRWTGPAVRVTLSDTALRFTPHATNLSVIYDGFALSGQGDPGLHSLTRTATFSARLEEVNPARRVRFSQDLHATVDKDADARIIIVVIFPDRTETLVYPYGRRVHLPDLTRTFRSSLRYYEGQEYTATVLVRVDRRRADALALVQIAAMDVIASQ